MDIKSIEEIIGSEHTKNTKEETRLNIKINKYGSMEDANAFKMLEYLKSKEINISKHIRLLLSMEYEGKLIVGESVIVPISSVPTSEEAIDVQSDEPAYEVNHGDIGNDEVF